MRSLQVRSRRSVPAVLNFIGRQQQASFDKLPTMAMANETIKDSSLKHTPIEHILTMRRSRPVPVSVVLLSNRLRSRPEGLQMMMISNLQSDMMAACLMLARLAEDADERTRWVRKTRERVFFRRGMWFPGHAAGMCRKSKSEDDSF